jgi:hypothetical protein
MQIGLYFMKSRKYCKIENVRNFVSNCLSNQSSMPMLHIHVHAACPLSMLHVNRTGWGNESWTAAAAVGGL